MTASRSELEKFENTRVQCCGYYYLHNDIKNNLGKTNRTTLLHDVAVLTPEGKFVIDHIWVQEANSIINVKPNPGDMVEFMATVTRYKKRLDIPNEEGLYSEFRWGLSRPQVVRHERAEEAEEEYEPVKPQPQPQPAADVLTVMRAVRRVSRHAWLAEALAHWDEVEATAAMVGGRAALAELLAEG